MQICLCGWYYDPRLFEALGKSGFKSFLISDPKRAHEMRKQREDYVLGNTSEIIVECRGLEWGRYDFFLKNVWDQKSDVLFMHDDIIVQNPETFNDISKCGLDQAFVFKTEEEEKNNGHMHGRGIFCSGRFLKWLLSYKCDCKQATGYIDNDHHKGQRFEGTGIHDGFWYDPLNISHINGKPPPGVRHYNEGIYHFAMVAGRAVRFEGQKDFLVRKFFIHPDFVHARRGMYLNEKGRWVDSIPYNGGES